MLANSPRIDIGPVPKIHCGKIPAGGMNMDKNLETYVDQIMNEQEHRNGIFSNFLDIVVGAISDYRCGADSRGSYNTRRGVL